MEGITRLVIANRPASTSPWNLRSVELEEPPPISSTEPSGEGARNHFERNSDVQYEDISKAFISGHKVVVEEPKRSKSKLHKKIDDPLQCKIEDFFSPAIKQI